MATVPIAKATFDLSKALFDLLLLTCCWCGRGLNERSLTIRTRHQRLCRRCKQLVAQVTGHHNCLSIMSNADVTMWCNCSNQHATEMWHQLMSNSYWIVQLQLTCSSQLCSAWECLPHRWCQASTHIFSLAHPPSAHYPHWPSLMTQLSSCWWWHVLFIYARPILCL